MRKDVKSREAKAKATRAVNQILSSAVKKSLTDIDLAKKQATLARKISLKFNIRLNYSLKRFVCHGCKSFIVPGRNARVRLKGEGTKLLLVTCLECGHINRKLLRHA